MRTFRTETTVKTVVTKTHIDIESAEEAELIANCIDVLHAHHMSTHKPVTRVAGCLVCDSGERLSILARQLRNPVVCFRDETVDADD